MRPEPMSAGLEIAPQLEVVVDSPLKTIQTDWSSLAIGCSPPAPVDDGQPAMAKRKPGGVMDGAAVRTAVMQALGHRADRARYVRGQVSFEADHSADATHVFNCSKVGAVSSRVKLRKARRRTRHL
jgi:hypothetical protein